MPSLWDVFWYVGLVWLLYVVGIGKIRLGKKTIKISDHPTILDDCRLLLSLELRGFL
jgi:hypothetical protein